MLYIYPSTGTENNTEQYKQWVVVVTSSCLHHTSWCVCTSGQRARTVKQVQHQVPQTLTRQPGLVHSYNINTHCHIALVPCVELVSSVAIGNAIPDRFANPGILGLSLLNPGIESSQIMAGYSWSCYLPSTTISHSRLKRQLNHTRFTIWSEHKRAFNRVAIRQLKHTRYFKITD